LKILEKQKYPLLQQTAGMSVTLWTHGTHI